MKVQRGNLRFRCATDLVFKISGGIVFSLLGTSYRLSNAEFLFFNKIF